MTYLREYFNQRVLDRDQHSCVNCGSGGTEVYHIMESRLFEDGGYYVDNGVTLCYPCRLLAEQTLLSCDELRSKSGIRQIVLPPHLEMNTTYDRWGNPILKNGQRLQGELFDEPEVQKILRPVLSHFTRWVKYPRTYHLRESPGISTDDRVIGTLDYFKAREVVITEKMDGENTTLYNDHIYTRSLNYDKHPSHGWMRAFHTQIKNAIPKGWRICGENLYARHFIKYKSLPSYFMGFSMWNEANLCLPWDVTLEWFFILGITPVPTLYRGLWASDALQSTIEKLNPHSQEGFVVRVVNAFHYKDFKTRVAKYVGNPNQTNKNWLRRDLERNQTLKKDSTLENSNPKTSRI